MVAGYSSAGYSEHSPFHLVGDSVVHQSLRNHPDLSFLVGSDHPFLVDLSFLVVHLQNFPVGSEEPGVLGTVDSKHSPFLVGHLRNFSADSAEEQVEVVDSGEVDDSEVAVVVGQNCQSFESAEAVGRAQAAD